MLDLQNSITFDAGDQYDISDDLECLQTSFHIHVHFKAFLENDFSKT